MIDSKVETSEQVDGLLEYNCLKLNLINLKWLEYYFNVKSSGIFYFRSFYWRESVV